MKYCINCGKELVEGADICLGCGAFLKKTSKSSKLPTWVIVLIVIFTVMPFIISIFLGFISAIIEDYSYNEYYNNYSDIYTSM